MMQGLHYVGPEVYQLKHFEKNPSFSNSKLILGYVWSLENSDLFRNAQIAILPSQHSVHSLELLSTHTIGTKIKGTTTYTFIGENFIVWSVGCS